MLNVAQVVSNLIGSDAIQNKQAKKSIRTWMSINPRYLLVELKRICLNSSANEKVVAKAADLIRQIFWG